jgi:hypothetical protein
MKEITIEGKDVKCQETAVLNHLRRYGSITAKTAYLEYGIQRLSAIIFNLRKDGYRILSSPMITKNRFGHTTRFVKYKYIKPIK